MWRMAAVRSATTSLLSTRISPLVGSVRPSRQWMMVVLPAPLGPSSAQTWP